MSQLSVPLGIVGPLFWGAVRSSTSRGTETPIVIRVSSSEAPMLTAELSFQDTVGGPPFQVAAEPIVGRACRQNDADDTVGLSVRRELYGPPFRRRAETVSCTVQVHPQLFYPFVELCSVCDNTEGASKSPGSTLTIQKRRTQRVDLPRRRRRRRGAKIPGRKRGAKM